MSKKILIVNDGFPPHNWGGASTIALLHAKGLIKRGYDVRVFTTTQDNKQPTGWSTYEGIPVCTFYTNYHPRWVAYRCLYNPDTVSAFKKEIQKLMPDIVHFHNVHNYFSYHTIAAAKKSGVKVFVTLHDVMSFAYQKLDQFIDPTNKAIPAQFDYRISWWQNIRAAKKRFNPVRNIAARYYLGKADKLLAVSGALRDALLQNGIHNVDVVHNGVAVESFEQPVDTEELRLTLGLDKAPLALFMGRLTPPKGSEVLFEAMSVVTQDLPSAKLLAVGTPIDERIEAALRHFNIFASVMLLSAVRYEDIYKFYHIADVVVFPSICLDTFGLANIEAGASGKPVIATCFGGSPEIIEDGVTGYIVNPLDTKLLAEKILFLLQHPDKAHEMGERGRARVEAHFTLEQQLDKYCRYY